MARATLAARPLEWTPAVADDTTSRRNFLAKSGAAAGGAWLLGITPFIEANRLYARAAARRGLPFATFTERESADFDAFAARIIPTDDTPGAREAGCVHFADRALETFLSDLLPIIRGGLESMNERVASMYAGRQVFARLAEDQQDAIITAIEQEDPGFFFFAKTLVTIGFVANPAYGGNQDKIGWKHIGFEDGFVYQPPFGYYDRNEHGPADDSDREAAQ